MRLGLLSPLVIAAVLLSALPGPAAADTTPTPTPSPSASATTDPSPDPSPSVTPSPDPALSSSPTATPTPTPAQTPQQSGPGAAPAPPAPAPSVGDPATQRLIEQTREQIGGGLADTLAAVQRLADALTENDGERGQVQSSIEESQARMDSLNDEIARLDQEIDRTQQRVDEERAEIRILARELYQQPDSLLLRLLQAGNARDMVTQAGDITAAALRADSIRQHLTDDLATLRSDQATRQSDLEAQDQAQAELSSALDQLQTLASEEQQTGDEMQSVIKDSQDALEDVGDRSAALAQQIAAMLRQRQLHLIGIAERQVWQQAQLWATLNRSTLRGITIEARPTSGSRFAWPIRGATLTQGFGPSTLWLEPAMYGFQHFHTGLDLASSDPAITAAADGVVAVVGSGTTGYGNYVIVVHPEGFVTLYGHLSLASVKVGQLVRQGEPIGLEGSTGASTGPHLHFEVRLNGTPVDPSPNMPAGGSI